MLAQADVARLRAARESDVFSTLDLNQWEGKEPPRRDWMVERCFVRGSVGLVSGDGGIGKSLLMQQLCTSAVTGRAFLGLQCQPGRALFLACEDDRDELWRRQYDINRSLGGGWGMTDLAEAGLFLAPRVGQNCMLAVLDKKEWLIKATDLFERLLEFCLRQGISYVVVDTATKTFAGNQNDEVQVDRFISLLRRVALAIQGIVLVTKHPSVAGRALGTGESGSVSWNNSVRARLYLHKDKDQGLILEHKKSNYGPADIKIPLVWDRGVFKLPEQPNYDRGRYGSDC